MGEPFYPSLPLMPQEAWRELDEPKASDLGVAGVIDASFATIEARKQRLVFGLDNPYPKDAVVPNTLSPRRRR